MYDMTVGLQVVDAARYAQYRLEMRPLLELAGGAFRFDFDVARTLLSEGGVEINRVFVIRFPDRPSQQRFFADPRYVEIRQRLFDPSVMARVLISESVTDGQPAAADARVPSHR